MFFLVSSTPKFSDDVSIARTRGGVWDDVHRRVFRRRAPHDAVDFSVSNDDGDHVGHDLLLFLKLLLL